MIINATEFPSEEYFDYIVVGGGTAGCPLAATLSRAFRVLVLERGGVPYGDANVMNQEGFLTALAEADADDSPAEVFTSEDGVPNARGRVLGGSSTINAGFYTRAEEEFYQKSGIAWDRKMVNDSFEWVESKIVFRPEVKAWQLGVRDGLLEVGVGPYNGFSLDHLLGTKVGGSILDSSGRRHSAADLLFYGRPPNLKVVVYASVEKILLASPAYPGAMKSANGVVFRDRRGKCHNAMVRENGEVLLSAGAIGSPQLLLLSGIGPRAYLSSWRIPVSHDLPYVGRFFYDNPRNSISIVPPSPLEHSLIQVVGISPSGAYIEAASNLVPFAAPPRTVFIRTPSSPIYLTVATIMSKINGPLSIGSFRLASTDVRTSPIVRFNYFHNPVDMDKCVNGTRTIGRVLRSIPMEEFKFRDGLGNRDFRFLGTALPADQSNYALMADFCRRTVSTIWHYHGGCLVEKVVEGDHRVIGLNSLRVVDGSTFVVSPGTNPQATVMMLGRYVGLKIIRERMRYR
ncbi:(R)-mandelonitrile lyase-like protein [Morus notabilis]|uniref:(R)-mandelonitrile lyase n=1 Tax=Morus notabilis TaxID=981085 RepID=W9S6L7_9ROSA|nr:(R)-mandelonitrile lyase-like [Morus notabilis]EXC28856.1 (R)-mandelonitrile lyase-like protein [Morus notabilis]